MAPTAMSPPYLSSDVLKLTDIMLSLDCIMKAARPSARQGSMTSASRRIFSFLSRSMVFSPLRKSSTHKQDMHWEMTVASAAPRTPISRPNMNTGSRIILDTAPISTVYMPVLEKPWAVMNAFMPRVSCTNIVPRAYMSMYPAAKPMVSGLAPKARSRSLSHIRSAEVSIADIIICNIKQLPSMRSAPPLSPRPMAMDARGVPPMDTRAAKADTTIMMGMHTPRPVSAREPPSGMWPIYILSTIL